MTDESTMRVVEISFELGGKKTQLHLRTALSVEQLKSVWTKVISEQPHPEWFGELVEVSEDDTS